jgi:hypothetical protein
MKITTTVQLYYQITAEKFLTRLKLILEHLEKRITFFNENEIVKMSSLVHTLRFK